jgi:hypothetical protein
MDDQGKSGGERARSPNASRETESPDMSGLSFLESVPAVSTKLKEPVTADRKFEDLVKSAEQAAVLVLVY